jgi:gluconolactonase
MSARGVTAVALVAIVTAPALSWAQPRALGTVADRKPDAVVDLRTVEGARLVQGTWRYRDGEIVPVDFRGPGADRRPSGAPVRTFDIEPRAGARDFDDHAWATIAADQLDARRTNGRLSFNW